MLAYNGEEPGTEGVLYDEPDTHNPTRGHNLSCQKELEGFSFLAQLYLGAVLDEIY